MPQQSMTEFVNDLERAGMLVRVSGETNVNDLPRVMEDHPTTAVLVENIKDCEFQFLANAYSNQDMYAWALECDKTQTGLKIVDRAKGRIKPEIIDTAPCKEVILKGDDVDLTKFPLFLHHDRDGHAYCDDNFVISKSPETNVPDWGMYRSMFRTATEKNFDMTCTSHRARLNAIAAQGKGQNLQVAVVIGGPILDHIAALAGVPPETDDFEVLGAFYGHAAKMVRCETIDVEVPANAEIVLECELIDTEGLAYDEGPYGEFSGMYGGGIKHNFRAKVHCITHRKNAIYQYATIGGKYPWYTDNMLQLPAIEADLFTAMQMAGIDVVEVRAPLGGLSNIAYAKIRPRGAGDAKQALGIMLTCSKQALPKIAMVFNDDVDIWDENAIAANMAFRYMPHRDTIIIPECNTMTVDPKINDTFDAPGTASKIGLDCTIGIGPGFDADSFTHSAATVMPPPPENVDAMTEAQLTADMKSFIEHSPRTWRDILTRYNGQPYPVIYRAFGNLRHQLGRADEGPLFPYTFSESPFATLVVPSITTHFDPRHG